MQAVKGQLLESQDKSKLNRVCQLSGFADPIYCEAQMNVLGYDLVLDLGLINQTRSVLQVISNLF